MNNGKSACKKTWQFGVRFAKAYGGKVYLLLPLKNTFIFLMCGEEKVIIQYARRQSRKTRCFAAQP